MDWSNRIYINAGTSNDGADSRLMVAVPNLGPADGGREWLSQCVNYTLSTLVELKTTGPGAIPGLLSTTAVGLAIGQSAHQAGAYISRRSGRGCDEHIFDFGGFMYKVSLAQCHRSQPEDHCLQEPPVGYHLQHS